MTHTPASVSELVLRLRNIAGRAVRGEPRHEITREDIACTELMREAQAAAAVAEQQLARGPKP